MLGQGFAQLLQFQLPFLRLLPPQLFRHRAIQFGLESLLQTALDGLNPLRDGFQRIPVEPGFLRRGGLQARFDILDHFPPDGHPIHDGPELLDQLLFPDGLPLLGARPLPARAMVIDVPALLDLRRNRTAAFLAGKEPAEDEMVLLLLGMVYRPESGLHGFKLVHGDETRIGALESMLAELEPPDIERVLQNLLQGGRIDLGTRGLIGEARPIEVAAESLQGEFPRGVPCEHFLHPWALYGVDVNAAGYPVVSVADGRTPRRQALGGLFQHSLGHLFAQVVDVVLGHEHLDAMDELFMGGGPMGKERSLLDQMDLQLVIIERDVIPKIPIQPVRLLDQQMHRGGVLLKIRQHLSKLGPPAFLGRLHVDKLLGDGKAMLRSVVAQ